MREDHRTGFTVIELLVVIAIIGVLIALLLPVISRVRDSAKGTQCLSNLHQVASAFHLYANDHDGELSYDFESSWLFDIQHYLTTSAATECPADSDADDLVLSVSYGWRDTVEVGDPAKALSGRKLATAGPGDLVFIFDEVSGWHGDHTVQAATLDTSSRRYTNAEFEENLDRIVQ